MTTQEFIFDTPLYHKIEGEDAKRIIEDLTSIITLKFDGFNAQRGIESTYSVWHKLSCRYNLEYKADKDVSDHKIFQRTESWYVTLRCGRYSDEIEIMILLDAADKSIMKVGQYPTIADVHKKQIKKYKKVLGDERMGEFSRAIGLAASGVGIGSFLYLRRIFESLIFDASVRAISDGVIKKEEFEPLHIEEKIATLKDYLPNTLIEIKSAYGILSKGIHELSEDECLKYFDVLRGGIEIILDELLVQMEKEKKKKLTLEAISKIHGELKSKK